MSKKKNPSTAITAAIVSPIKALATIERHAPKPTKTEVIEALVVRAREKAIAQHAAWREMADEVDYNVKALAREEVRTKSHELDCTVHLCHNGIASISYAVTSPEIKAEMKRLEDAPRVRWDEKQVRADIRAALSTRRHDGLLQSPEAVKAMDAMLAAWGM